MAKHKHILKQRYTLTVRAMGLLGVILLIAAFLIFPRFGQARKKWSEQCWKEEMLLWSCPLEEENRFVTSFPP